MNLEAHSNPEVAHLASLFCDSTQKRPQRRQSNATLSSVELTPLPHTLGSDDGSHMQLTTSTKAMSFRHWIQTTRDFSTQLSASKLQYLKSGAKEDTIRSYGSTPRAIGSKKQSTIGFGDGDETDKSAGVSKSKSRRKVEFDNAKEKLLAHLDLSNNEVKGRYAKNFNEAIKSKDKLRAKAKKLRKVRFLGVEAEESDESIKCESLADVFKLKEEEVNALNYNCDFNRLT